MSKMSKAFSLLLLRAALAGALAAPALAQDGNPMAATQYPPSAQELSAQSGPQSLNSLPRSAATAVRERPGSDIETTRIAPVAGTASATEEPAG